MIDIYGKDLQKSGLSGGGDSVCRVVRVSPCIGAVGEAAVRKVVYYAFVRVLLGAHEDQTREAATLGTKPRVPTCYSLLQCVRTTSVIKDCVLSDKHKLWENLRTFSSHDKITVHNRGYSQSKHEAHKRDEWAAVATRSPS